MSETKYKVILRGGVQEGWEFNIVVAKVAQLVKMPEEKVITLLKGESTVVKKSLTLSLATKYQDALSACGAICLIAGSEEDSYRLIDGEEEEIDAVPLTTPGISYGSQSGGASGMSNSPAIVNPLEQNSVIPAEDSLDNGKPGNQNTTADNYKDIDSEQDKDFVSRSDLIRKPTKRSKLRLAVGSSIIVFGAWWLGSVGWPAYQHYLVREKLTQDFGFVRGFREQVTTYIQQTGTWPNSNAEVGLSDSLSSVGLENISLGEESVLTLFFREDIVGQKNTLKYVPRSNDHKVVWHCEGGNLPDKYRPLGCRAAVPQDMVDVRHFKPVGGDRGRARMAVPSHWTTLVGLSREAEIQAASLQDESYVMVVVQDKIDQQNLSVVAYGEKVVEQVFMNISKPKVLSGPHKKTIDGKRASRYWVEGSIDGIDITYLITVVEGETQFYQIFSWTLTDHFDQNKAILKTVSDSFYEVGET